MSTTSKELELSGLAPDQDDSTEDTETNESSSIISESGPTGSGSRDQYWNLFIANFCVGIVQLLTWIALLTLAMTVAKHASIPWYSNFASQRPDYVTSFEWAPDPKKYKDVHVGHFSAIFILLSAIYHLSVATIFKSKYERDLNQRRNPLRWLEYSFSSSLMHVHVAMICGLFDAHACFLIFGLSATTMIFGYLTEPRDGDSTSKMDERALWLGFVPYLTMWLVIFCYFFYAVSHSKGVPDWVYSIIAVIFVLDSTFAVNLALSVRRVGWWKNYLVGEYAFILLSLLSKQSLAWINFQGTMNVPDH